MGESRTTFVPRTPHHAQCITSPKLINISIGALRLLDFKGW